MRDSRKLPGTSNGGGNGVRATASELSKLGLPPLPADASAVALSRTVVGTPARAASGDAMLLEKAAKLLHTSGDGVRFDELQSDAHTLIKKSVSVISRSTVAGHRQTNAAMEQKVLGTVGAVLQMYTAGEVADLLLDCDQREREVLVRGLMTR